MTLQGVRAAFTEDDCSGLMQKNNEKPGILCQCSFKDVMHEEEVALLTAYCFAQISCPGLAKTTQKAVAEVSFIFTLLNVFTSVHSYLFIFLMSAIKNGIQQNQKSPLFYAFG